MSTLYILDAKVELRSSLRIIYRVDMQYFSTFLIEFPRKNLHFNRIYNYHFILPLQYRTSKMLTLASIFTIFLGLSIANPVPETAFPDVGISDLDITTYATTHCDGESKTWPAVHYGTNQGRQFHSMRLSRGLLPNERLDISVTGPGGDFCDKYLASYAAKAGPGLYEYNPGNCAGPTSGDGASCFRLRTE